MDNSAATQPSSSTAASATTPATPAALEQLDTEQVSGPWGGRFGSGEAVAL